MPNNFSGQAMHDNTTFLRNLSALEFGSVAVLEAQSRPRAISTNDNHARPLPIVSVTKNGCFDHRTLLICLATMYLL